MLPDELPEGYLAVTAEGWYDKDGNLPLNP